jgi:NAD(P)H-hydrate epimerase
MDRPRTITREQARELDRRAIEEYGIPSIVLMENAARACADECERVLRLHGVRRELNRLRAPGSKDDVPRTVEELHRWKQTLSEFPEPAYIFCGPGNNGGDGLAIARTLFNRGFSVRVFGEPGNSLDVQTNAKLLRGLGIQVEPLDASRPALGSAPLIVDALFGTGLARTLEDPWRATVQAINDSGAPVLAVDIPSGLDANTGNVLGVCVRASVTVTFTAAKPGFYDKAGPTFCGKVVVAEIGIPRTYVDAEDAP